MPIGLTIPFARSSGSVGYFEVTRTELAAVEQNLRSLLLTNWGERVMHFRFGCNLREFLFEQEEGDVLKERISDRVTSQVDTWMPFVAVDSLVVTTPEDDPSVPDNSFSISIGFRLKTRPDLSSRFDLVFPPV